MNTLKMNKQKLLIITLSIIIVGLLFYFLVVPLIYNSGYNSGYSDGQILIINEINNNGRIPVYVSSDNSTQINWFTLDQICLGEG